MALPESLIDEIRLNYRLAKFAETERISLDHKLVSFARVYASDWLPSLDEKARKQFNAQALRVIKTIRKNTEPKDEDCEMFGIMQIMVLGMEPARETLENERKLRRKQVEKLVASLPAWPLMEHIVGFSKWGLGVIVGEFGDLTDDIMPAELRVPGKRYSGVRRIYKRFGLAPNDCYEAGEKKTGRKVPRSTRGRIIGILFDPLIKHQWAAERGPDREALKASEKGADENAPAHPKGPYGLVYRDVKERALQTGKTNGHAFALGRRAMIKALIHDVHKAWHGEPLTFSSAWESQEDGESHREPDLPADDSRFDPGRAIAASRAFHEASAPGQSVLNVPSRGETPPRVNLLCTAFGSG